MRKYVFVILKVVCGSHKFTHSVVCEVHHATDVGTVAAKAEELMWKDDDLHGIGNPVHVEESRAFEISRDMFIILSRNGL